MAVSSMASAYSLCARQIHQLLLLFPSVLRAVTGLLTGMLHYCRCKDLCKDRIMHAGKASCPDKYEGGVSH